MEAVASRIFGVATATLPRNNSITSPAKDAATGVGLECHWSSPFTEVAWLGFQVEPCKSSFVLQNLQICLRIWYLKGCEWVELEEEATTVHCLAGQLQHYGQHGPSFFLLLRTKGIAALFQKAKANLRLDSIYKRSLKQISPHNLCYLCVRATSALIIACHSI